MRYVSVSPTPPHWAWAVRSGCQKGVRHVLTQVGELLPGEGHRLTNPARSGVTTRRLTYLAASPLRTGKAGNVILDTRIWAVTYSAPFHRAGPPDQERLLGSLRRKRRGTHARREESAAAVQLTCKLMPKRMRDTHA